MVLALICRRNRRRAARKSSVRVLMAFFFPFVYKADRGVCGDWLFYGVILLRDLLLLVSTAVLRVLSAVGVLFPGFRCFTSLLPLHSCGIYWYV
jgi:hypothetical protein